MLLKINLEEKKKTPRVHLLTQHQSFRYWFIQQVSKSFYGHKSDNLPSLILSGATFTFSPQEIQGRLPIDTDIISELAHKCILYITDSLLLACRSCIDWIICSAEHHNSGFYISAFCPYWLQFWRNKLEASKHPSPQSISQHILHLWATLILVLFLGTRISGQ